MLFNSVSGPSFQTSQLRLSHPFVHQNIKIDSSPSVTINQAVAQADPTNDPFMKFTIWFSEDVYGFDAVNITQSGTATINSLTVDQITPSNYTVNVTVATATTVDTVILSVNAGAARSIDSGIATRASTSTDNSITYDTIRPSVTINQASWQHDPTNQIPVVYQVIWSESVVGFTNSSINTLGQTASHISVVGGPLIYNVSITPVDGISYWQGQFNILPMIITDLAGNLNTQSASTDNTIIVDTVSPTPVIEVANLQVSPTGVVPIQFTMTVDRSVDDSTLSASDFNCNATSTAKINETATMFTGSGSLWQFYVYPLTSG
jgi:hypothetical protein